MKSRSSGRRTVTASPAPPGAERRGVRRAHPYRERGEHRVLGDGARCDVGDVGPADGPSACAEVAVIGVLTNTAIGKSAPGCHRWNRSTRSVIVITPPVPQASEPTAGRRSERMDTLISRGDDLSAHTRAREREQRHGSEVLGPCREDCARNQQGLPGQGPSTSSVDGDRSMALPTGAGHCIHSKHSVERAPSRGGRLPRSTPDRSSRPRPGRPATYGSPQKPRSSQGRGMPRPTEPGR
jgi:hypothetical protein